MKKTFCDWTFGINNQALAVAHLLDRLEERRPSERFPEGVYCRMSPWYNGRERGIVWQIGRIAGTVLNIAVFEHRNSDDICALRWERQGFGINPPTIESDGEFAYPTDSKYCDIAKCVGHGSVGDMARWIEDEVTRFFRERSDP